jgi:CelD/BcsL family acetyltransferase involved in cellulose biosynthesis
MMIHTQTLNQTNDVTGDRRDRSFELQIVEGAGAASRFADDWDDLFARAPEATPYLSRHWISTFISEKKFKGKPLFMLCWCQSKLVTLFSLTIHERLGVRIAEPTGSWLPSYLGLLADPDYPEAVDRIVEAFHAGKVADVFCSENLSSDDRATKSFLERIGHRGSSVYRVHRHPCPFIRLGCSYEEYLQKAKSGRSRQTLRRKERILRKRHEVNVERYSNGEITDAVIERIASIQEQSWMKRRGAAVLGQPFYRKLLLDIARAGLASAWLMTIDNTDAAFVFALIAHGRLYYAWTSFKLAYASSLSVGQVLTSRVIHDACDDGITLFDFGHGEAEYKRFWGTDEHGVHRFVTGRGVRGRLVAFLHFLIWRLATIKWCRSLYSSIKSVKGRGKMRHEAFRVVKSLAE